MPLKQSVLEVQKSSTPPKSTTPRPWDGAAVRLIVGAAVGVALFFFPLGVEVGEAVGFKVGEAGGVEVGAAVGVEGGEAVGVEVGETVGVAVGLPVRAAVGAPVGATV